MTNEQLNKKFLKDTNLPIHIASEPYFSYFLNLYDPFLNCVSKYNEFLKTYNAGDAETFKKEYFEFFEEVVRQTASKEAYQKFNNSDFKQYNDMPFPKEFQKDIYKAQHSGKRFVTFDLKKANFYSLLDFDDTIFDGHATYEDWILSFENGYKFVDYKPIRQIIFGHLSPKRQQTVQKHFILHLIKHLIDIGLFNDKDGDTLPIYVMGADEFLVEADVIEDVNSFITEAYAAIDLYMQQNNRKFIVVIDSFVLEKIGEHNGLGYVRKMLDGTYDFKSVTKKLFPQAIKKLTNEPLNEFDLTFINEEGVLSRMLEPIE